MNPHRTGRMWTYRVLFVAAVAVLIGVTGGW